MSTISRSVQNRITATIFVGQALFSAGTIAAFTITPIIARNLSDTNYAGMPQTLGQAGRAIFAYFVGWLMIKFGRRQTLSYGYLLAGLGGALSIVAVMQEQFWILLAGGLLIGLARGATEQGRYVAAEVYRPENRAPILGIIVAAGTIGSVLGPNIVAPSQWVAERLGLDVATGPYIFTLGVMVIAALAMFFFLRPDPGILSQQINEEIDDPTVSKKPARPQGELLRLPRVQLAIVAMSIGFLVMVLLMVITPLHMDNLGQDSAAISRVIMFHTLGMFAFSWMTGFFIRRVGQIWVIMIGALTLIAACVIAPIASSVWMLSVALYLLGLGWNFAYVGGSSLLTVSVTEAERPRMQSTAEAVVAVSSMLASLSTGFIYGNLGMVMTGVVGFVASAILILVLFWTVPRKPASYAT